VANPDRGTNRLGAESSAYLRQHRENPVDWYPWGDEAWQRARSEDRPVLVSIGYSSCHWCHVMERESFEDAETAAFMNERLVCIKVDREERPDVDQIYMETVVRLTGSGGWPLNVFCTPDGRPFYGGTYFPPGRAHGRASWREVVDAVTRAYTERRGEVEEQAGRITETLAARPPAADGSPGGLEALGELARALMAQADRGHGGFGSAPKFPTPTNLEALLLARALHADPGDAFEHVRLTLHRMARGGIYDQLGGGFHRYSTDARWLVPHFEKMLYDQGQLLRVYSEAYRQDGGADPELCWPVEETIEFLERELRGPEGGFFASLDADSLDPDSAGSDRDAEEGLFYVWKPSEIEAVLGPEAGAEFAAAYGVEPGGNFERTGRSVLEHALAGERPRFAEARRRLFEARAPRPRPDTDPKHVTSWIAYTLGGLATAGAAFERPDWVAAAARAADFLLEHMLDPEGRLLRIWDGERARIPGFLDDHAAALCALLDLQRAGGDERYVRAALGLAGAIRERFFDPEVGDLFFAPADGERLVVRPGSDSDGATPGAAGLAALGLVRAGELSGRPELLEVADAVIAVHSAFLERAPAQVPTLVRAAALRAVGPGLGLVIGDPDAAATRALAARARQLLGSEDGVVVARPGERPPWLDAAWLEGRSAVDGAPTAYICRGRACSLPATEPGSLSLPGPLGPGATGPGSTGAR
jgi:uncharacterized protein YyaL (SSP411 family)